MADIRDIDVRRIDATLLMVFLGCMRHRKATAVAEEMGLTQPAISHALKRLRSLYNDPLFLRRAHGLEPTALALQLEPMILQVVRLMSDTLTTQEEFDPATSKANLKIGAFDYELTTIVPDLIAHLRHVSPGISLQAYPLTNRDALEALVDGQIDMAIGYFELPPHSQDIFVTEALLNERYVVAAHAAHPIFAQPLTLESYATAEHLLVSPFGPMKTMVDYAVQVRGHQRLVRTTVPTLFSGMSVIEQTDLVVTVPERLAARFADRFNLVYKPLPFSGGTFQLHLVRHVRDAQNTVQSWLAQELKNVVTEAGLRLEHGETAPPFAP